MTVDYPRVRDLPQQDQIDFLKWLLGKYRPIGDPGEPIEQWDWYFPGDHSDWKKQKE